MVLTVLVVSDSPHIECELSRFFCDREYIVKNQKCCEKAILTSFEDDTDFCIYDIDVSSANHFDTINIIKKLKPNLPIIVLNDDNSFEHLQKIAQLNVFYCAIKPLQMGELESVVDSVERAKMFKNNQFKNKTQSLL